MLVPPVLPAPVLPTDKAHPAHVPASADPLVPAVFAAVPIRLAPAPAVDAQASVDVPAWALPACSRLRLPAACPMDAVPPVAIAVPASATNHAA